MTAIRLKHPVTLITVATAIALVPLLIVIDIAFIKNVRHPVPEEVRLQYSNCLQDGGAIASCNHFLNVMKRVSSTHPANACEAAEIGALSACVDKREADSFSGGQIDYTAVQRARDIPLCENIARAAYFSCRQF